MKGTFFILILQMILLSSLQASDFLITHSLAEKKIVCNIQNLSNDFIRYTDENGSYHMLDVAKDYVYKVKLGETQDTVIIIQANYKCIEAEIIEKNGNLIRYIDSQTNQEESININDLAYIDFYTLDSTRLKNYQSVLKKATQQAYNSEFVTLKTALNSFVYARIIEFNKKEIKLSAKVSNSMEAVVVEPFSNVKEVQFIDFPSLGLSEGGTNTYGVFGKKEYKGKLVSINADKLDILSNKENISTISYSKRELLSLENTIAKKMVRKENTSLTKRLAINAGVGYNLYKDPEESYFGLTNIEDHESKLRTSAVLSTSYSISGKSGNGIGMLYKLFYSSSKSDAVRMTVSDSVFYTTDIIEKNYRHYVGLSYIYLSSSSIMGNGKIFRFSIGPGIMLNYFPVEFSSKDEKFTIRNTSLGLNSSIGYDFVSSSYIGVGLEISYTLNNINRIRLNGLPYDLSDDYSQLSHLIEVSIGIRFY